MLRTSSPKPAIALSTRGAAKTRSIPNEVIPTPRPHHRHLMGTTGRRGTRRVSSIRLTASRSWAYSARPIWLTQFGPLLWKQAFLPRAVQLLAFLRRRLLTNQVFL